MAQVLLGKHEDLNLYLHCPHKSRLASVTSGPGSGQRQEELEDSLVNQWRGNGGLHVGVETLS